MKSKQMFLKCVAVLLLSFCSILPNAQARDQLSRIPDMEGWKLKNEMFQEFSAPSGNYGTWHQRVFADPSERAVVVNLLSGEGPGKLYLPTGPVSHDDRPIGFGATYETIQIEGFQGILEYYPYAGYALAISLPEISTLCVESKALSKEQLFSFTQTLIRRILSSQK